MSTDAIVLLKKDHKEIRRAFSDFESAGENAHERKGKIVDRIIELLTVHTYIENVRHHIEEEEDEWFPKVRDGLGRKALQEIGAEMQAAKERAPRKPSQPSALKKTIDAVIR